MENNTILYIFIVIFFFSNNLVQNYNIIIYLYYVHVASALLMNLT